MKYFTPEWWMKADGSTQVAETYRAYLSTVREQLPAALLEFADDHTLHDSTILRVDENSEKRTLLILFDGWNQRFDQRIQYTLKFSGVSHFDQSQLINEDARSQLGDVGYIELEPNAPHVEMRILFTSFIEVKIVFETFGFEYIGA
jgi:hypothetical protein